MRPSESGRALACVDALMWFGPNFFDSSLGTAWREILRISASLDGEARIGIGSLGDRDALPNVLSENRGRGGSGRHRPGAGQDAGRDAAFSVDDPRFAATSDGTVTFHARAWCTSRSSRR